MVAISVENLIKTYRLYRTPKDRVRELLSCGRRTYHHVFRALNDVTFAIERGQTVGIIGQNGSGKSTLLKLICGVIRPTAGMVSVNGRISSLLELGAGFHPDFTGRDNVYMNATLLGLSREEIDRRIPDIEAFADIGEYIDQPVRTYSNGMYVRLAFSVAVNIDPDILVVDEALAVGDARFQRKCFLKIEEFRDRGVTILFVSHDLSAIRFLCSQAILLRSGEMVECGEVRHVTSLYNELIFSGSDGSTGGRRVSAPSSGDDDSRRHGGGPVKTSVGAVSNGHEDSGTPTGGSPSERRYGNRRVEIIEQGIRDEFEKPVEALEMGQRYTFFLKARYTVDVSEMVAGLAIKNVRGLVLTSAGTDEKSSLMTARGAGSIVEVRFSLEMWLHPGSYFADVELRKAVLSDVYDRKEDSLEFKVVSSIQGRKYWGVVSLPSEVSVHSIAGGERRSVDQD